MYKHAFSDTGDGYGFFLENLDDPYSLVCVTHYIECMADTCDGIKKYKIALPVISAPKAFFMMLVNMIMLMMVVRMKMFKMYI